MAQTKFNSIDEYISSFPDNVQKILEEVRQTIKTAAPNAEEAISYQIPTFKLNGNLVHFAAFKNHIGFFPTAKPIEVFKKDMMKYKTSKGTIQFPLDKKIPFGLINEITKFRLQEVLEKQNQKK